MSRRKFHLLILPLDVLVIAVVVGALIDEPALWIPATVVGTLGGGAFALYLRKHPLESQARRSE